MAKAANPFSQCNTVAEVLGQLAGAAALCWENGETPFEAPVYDTTSASELVGQAESRLKAITAQAITTL